MKMKIILSCPFCGSENIKRPKGELEENYYRDFYCLDCDEDFYFNEVDWEECE